MNTLNQNELVSIYGGLDPFNVNNPTDYWDLQWFIDQLARQEEEKSLSFLLGGSAE